MGQDLAFGNLYCQFQKFLIGLVLLFFVLTREKVNSNNFENFKSIELTDDEILGVWIMEHIRYSFFARRLHAGNQNLIQRLEINFAFVENVEFHVADFRGGELE